MLFVNIKRESNLRTKCDKLIHCFPRRWLLTEGPDPITRPTLIKKNSLSKQMAKFAYDYHCTALNN